MGKTDQDAPAHRRQTMVLVPMDAPGVRNVRSVPVFGRQDQHGHNEIVFDAVRVPVTSVLGEEGGGFAAAQARLGPGRIHHCMRGLGAAERALALMVARANSREAFGAKLADQGVVRHATAESRIDIEQARLICHRASHVIDTAGNKGARDLVAMAKVAVPRAVTRVLDRSIQLHGGAGVSDDTPLTAMWGRHRAMRSFDGPDGPSPRAGTDGAAPRAALARAVGRGSMNAVVAALTSRPPWWAKAPASWWTSPSVAGAAGTEAVDHRRADGVQRANADWPCSPAVGRSVRCQPRRSCGGGDGGAPRIDRAPVGGAGPHGVVDWGKLRDRRSGRRLVLPEVVAAVDGQNLTRHVG